LAKRGHAQAGAEELERDARHKLRSDELDAPLCSFTIPAA
jgi:hypothetical protein